MVELRGVAPGGLDPAGLFEGAGEIWLEIGFGGGEHLVEQVQRLPGVGVIGCEPFVEGVAKALTGVEAAGIDARVRLHMGDAREVIDALAEASLARVFILFPDPWPKRRHWKRRIVQQDFLDALARVVRPGGRVRFATDVMSYADEALWRFVSHAAFEWSAWEARDWREPPGDHVRTRYEAKGLGDCAPVFLDFVRRPA